MRRELSTSDKNKFFSTNEKIYFFTYAKATLVKLITRFTIRIQIKTMQVLITNKKTYTCLRPYSRLKTMKVLSTNRKSTQVLVERQQGITLEKSRGNTCIT